MKKALTLYFLSLFALITNAQTIPLTDLMPMPQHITFQDGRFALASNFTVGVKADKTDTILFKAINRAFQLLNRKTTLWFGQQYITPADNSDTASLLIIVKQKVSNKIGVDESYTINVEKKQLVIGANTTIGALRGLETLLQLVAHDDGGYYVPVVTINDKPRFVWRGLMIDVARHFIPLDVIERNLDAMAAVKMNVLHFHLSDDEGFRIASKIYPDLQKRGSNGDHYTQAQIRELITYANERGITIIPEFDMPGHTTSWLAGYPALAAAPGPYTPGPRFQINKPGQRSMGLGDIMKMINTYPTPAFDVSKESTYIFLDKFFGEMAVLFPSPYLHIGADEVNGVAWKNNPAIVKFMQQNKISDTHALQAYFVSRITQILTKHHKKAVGWEELLSPGLAKDVTVEVWQDPAKTAKAIAHGNNVIVADGFYLDVFMPAGVHYNNPNIPDTAGSAVASKFIGGEAAQWTEAADKDNIETRMWPRAAAIAERLWSAASVKNTDDMYRRLFATSAELDERGLQHIGDYERNLRRLSGGADVLPLKTLCDVLTPLKGYKKLFARMTQPAAATYQTAPLTNISDIVFVDPEVKRMFRNEVKIYLANKDTVAERAILTQLNIWKNCRPALLPLINDTPTGLLIDVQSKNLVKAAQLGLEAMALLKAGNKPAGDVLKQETDPLSAINKPYGETELAIIPEILGLVQQQLDPEPVSYPVF